MIDEILQKRPRKKAKDLNIVPILDMLVTVIFFLLMSTSFMEYTKLTLPPASTVSAPNTNTAPPVAPKLAVHSQGNGYLITLLWNGEKPGQKSLSADEATVLSKTQEILKEFSLRYPKEKTLQLALGQFVKYQVLISVMDGARDYTPDMVLTSYQGETAEEAQ